MIEITEQQRQAVMNGEAVHVEASEFGEDLVLLTAKQFQSMQESLDDQREPRTALQHSMSQAERVAQEQSPIPRSLIVRFLYGAGSVLELFPSPERFDSWRLGHDVDVADWPALVRELLAGTEANGSITGETR